MARTILYICPSSGLGGAETFLKTTLLASNHTHFHSIYLLFQSGPLYDWLLAHGATVICLPQRPRLSQPWTIWQTQKKIKEIIQKYKVHIVHSTMAYGALFSAIPSLQTKTPHLWFQHGPASGWMDQLAAILPHQMVLVNSQYTLEKQLELQKIWSFFVSKNQKIKKIDLGVFASSSHPQTPHSIPIFAMACRLQKWKGIHLVIEAAQKLFVQNKKFQIKIWGDVFDSEDYVNELKKQASGLPISFEGPCPDVPLAFSNCDVVINSSLQPEPFGLTLIEAFSVGRPVIAPREGGPAEIVEEGKNGLLFTPRSSDSLAEKINWMIDHPEQRQKMKDHALESFQKKYSAQTMMGTLELIYNDLLNTAGK